MGIPVDKYTPDGSSDPAIFNGLSNSPDGTPRAASSNFPTETDTFPILIDGTDKKVFAYYFHLLSVAVIAVQNYVKTVLSSAVHHIHNEFSGIYAGTAEIDLTEPYQEDSTTVFLRGRKLIRDTHYTEDFAAGTITLTLTPPIGVENGDTIEVLYRTDAI